MKAVKDVTDFIDANCIPSKLSVSMHYLVDKFGHLIDQSSGTVTQNNTDTDWNFMEVREHLTVKAVGREIIKRVDILTQNDHVMKPVCRVSLTL